MSSGMIELAAGALTRSLGTARLAALVVAAVAPLASVVGVLPVALVFGGGAALPLALLVATAIVALFAVGYAAMSRETAVGGGMPIYVARGLGPVFGLGAGWVAALAYAAFVPGGLCYTGYILASMVVEKPEQGFAWGGFALATWLPVAWFGYRRVDLGARLVALLIVAEFALVAVFDAGVVWRLGGAALPPQALDVAVLLAGKPGVALLLAFSSFLGIECAALYSEETHAPERSVAHATYLAVAGIGLSYFFTAWIMAGAIGPERIRAIPEAEVALVFFSLGEVYLSPAFAQLTRLALATSMFATVLAIHNVAARNCFVLGRQGHLPQALARVHARHGSPYVASLALSVFALAGIVLGSNFNLHPALDVGLNALGFATVGVMFLQALTSAAVVVYFWHRPERHVWRHVVAPGLACAGLSAACVVAAANFEYLGGGANPALNLLPLGVLLVMAVGMAQALWLERRQPGAFFD